MLVQVDLTLKESAVWLVTDACAKHMMIGDISKTSTFDVLTSPYDDNGDSFEVHAAKET